MKEVLKALRPVRARIRRNRFLRGAAAGLAAGLSAAALLQAASFFAPVPDRGLWAAVIAAAAVLAAALGNALRPVRDTAAAEAADACGQEERAITALEPGEEPIRQLQRRDACEALGKLDVKRIRPGSTKKALAAAACCAAVLCALLLVPNAQDTAAEARKALTRTLKEGREAVERAAEEDEERLPDEKKSELRKITADLNRELSESRDAADAMVAMDRAEQRLEELRQQTAGDAAAAAEAMAGEGRDGSGEKGQGGTGEDNPSAGSATRAGDGQQGTDTAAASAATAEQMKTLQALANLKNAVNPSALQAQNIAAGYGMQGSQNGQNGAGAAGAGQGQGGETGGGAGEGTTNLEEKGGGSQNGAHSKGNRDPKYKETAYETIYDPEHIDRAKQDVGTEEKRLTDEGAVQLETGPGQGNLNGDVPWGEVLQEYAETEALAADRENLTVRERQWVEEYYRLLVKNNEQ